MVNYIKKHVFAKIGILFFAASFCVVFSGYYITINWTNLEKDDILDAHDAYFQYKLIESWGRDPDTSLIAKELKNLHLQGMVYYIDGDTLCENDSLVFFWSNILGSVSPCDYLSTSDSDYFEDKYNIHFDERVSFGETLLDNKLLQTTYLEHPPYKYFLITGFSAPLDFYTLFPSLVLSFVLMTLLFFVMRRFLLPLNLIEKRIVALERGDLDSNIPIIGKDELASLSVNFNKLISDVRGLLKQKERLLSDVSHELRSPLAKIKLAIALLPKHKKVEKINKQITTLDSMITNILLSDKMASAYSNLKKETIEIELLISKAIELTSVKNVKFNINTALSLSVDVVKSSIAIKNLIENAEKYSPVNAEILIKTEETSLEIIISVVDAGPGVPKHQLDKITTISLGAHVFLCVSQNKNSF